MPRPRRRIWVAILAGGFASVIVLVASTTTLLNIGVLMVLACLSELYRTRDDEDSWRKYRGLPPLSSSGDYVALSATLSLWLIASVLAWLLGALTSELVLRAMALSGYVSFSSVYGYRTFSR